jgi:hypothetical protein
LRKFDRSSPTTRALLGFEPEIFFVSAKLALRARRSDPSVWAAGGFEALETYVATTLNASGRAQLKLRSSPTRRGRSSGKSAS